ncbi:hypothetical protein SAMN05443543_101566 [Flavobacterium flevense]|nr:hypothetical protein SAMN05443543_101566 [Flavobacterium flevense]
MDFFVSVLTKLLEFFKLSDRFIQFSKILFL